MYVKTFAMIALALAVVAPASAQSIGLANTPTLSFSRSADRDTWHTVMIVSAVVGIVGLLDGDGTLAVLGGAGVALSLIESDSSRFQLRPFRYGLNLAKAGPLSFGIDPIGLSPVFAKPRPSVFVRATFKF
ncbi:MAG TPA: hypothetical protein VHE55_12865 [Fimbriimonadaceae bacterium]|nr:hypothetical protein [Fimbriimonadaceae bacterium]